MSLDNYIMPRVNVLEKGADRVKISLCIPNELPHLAGHFPGNPVTPSIILIEASALLIKECFELNSKEYKELVKSRVMKMVLPEQLHFVEILKENENAFQVIWYNEQDEVSARFNLRF